MISGISRQAHLMKTCSCTAMFAPGPGRNAADRREMSSTVRRAAQGFPVLRVLLEFPGWAIVLAASASGDRMTMKWLGTSVLALTLFAVSAEARVVAL